MMKTAKKSQVGSEVAGAEAGGGVVSTAGVSDAAPRVGGGISGAVAGGGVGGGGGYQVGRFTGRCAVSGGVLEPGSTFVVALVDVCGVGEDVGGGRAGGGGGGGGGGLVRVDVSLSAWEAAGEAGAVRSAVVAKLQSVGVDVDGGLNEQGLSAHGKVFAVWRARVPMAGEKRRLLADDDVLLEVFDQLTESTGGGEGGDGGGGGGRAAAFRFVLALLLVRKKLLVLERTTRDALFVRHRGVAKPPPAGDGPALIEVADPGLTPDDAAALASELDVVMAEPGVGA